VFGWCGRLARCLTGFAAACWALMAFLAGHPEGESHSRVDKPNVLPASRTKGGKTLDAFADAATWRGGAN
jgi:hypothetical protein